MKNDKVLFEKSRKMASFFVCLTLIIVPAVLFFCIMTAKPMIYKTTDIKDYGKYIGNYDRQFPSKFINSFFPESIDTDSVEVVKYSYFAKKLDTYGFEAYLELRFFDTTTFNQYVSAIADNSQWEPFEYDSSFMVYNIENKYSLGSGMIEDYYPIEQAKVRKILYCAETQTIIYSAIGVYDGGGTGTNELHVFFDRFSIDPAKYAQNADSSHGSAYEID